MNYQKDNFNIRTRTHARLKHNLAKFELSAKNVSKRGKYQGKELTFGRIYS